MIELEPDLTTDDGDLLHLTLTSRMTTERVEIIYPISDNTPSRRYHMREALVIAMRRVISEACQKGLIPFFQ
jgi:hypothetical protein